MKKWMVIVMIAAALFSLTACGNNEETSLTGMVVSVDGTVISLARMNSPLCRESPQARLK